MSSTFSALLVGDCNLVQEKAEEAVSGLQPDVADSYLQVWHVHSSKAGRGGDLMFIKGAHARPFELPFGASYPDKRGPRNDKHDAFGLSINVPAILSEPAIKTSRTHGGQREKFVA